MKKEAFAKKAAQLAAVEIYKAAKQAKVVKVASRGGLTEAIDIESTAKRAAVEAYKAVIKAAQLGLVPADEMNLQALALRFKLRNLAGYLADKTEEAKPYAQQEVLPFLEQYKAAKQVSADGQPVPPDVLAKLVEAAKTGLRAAGLQA